MLTFQLVFINKKMLYLVVASADHLLVLAYQMEVIQQMKWFLQ